MSFQNKLKEIFFFVAGTNFPYARRRFYEGRARDSFKTAMILLDSTRNFDTFKGTDEKRIELKNKAELSEAHFEHALMMLDKTERLPFPEYYHEVFGVYKEEFDLDALEAKFQIDYLKNPERKVVNFTHDPD